MISPPRFSRIVFSLSHMWQNSNFFDLGVYLWKIVCNSTVLPYCCFIFCVLLFQNMPCLQLMLLVGWQEGHPACKKNWVVGYWHGYLSGARCRLAYGPADASATHCLASVKSRLFLFFWYRLTQVVLEKGPSNGCVCAYYSNIQKCILIWYTVFSTFKTVL